MSHRFAHPLDYDRAVPPFLDQSALTEGFGSTGWNGLTIAKSTGSTNADLAAAARSGAPGGTVLVTADQQAGRGRFDRVWRTPPDTCVALSVLVRPRVGVERWGWLSLLVGIAVVDGVRAATGLGASVKWPNDVLIGGRKTCGILSEAVETDTGRAAVLGVGLNIALQAADLPVPTATSLALEGSDAPADAVVLAVLAALHDWYRRWDASESLLDAYRQRSGTLGRRVRVHLPAGDVEGVAIDVDDDGSLVVQTAQGVRTFAAGDVVHLRAGE